MPQVALAGAIVGGTSGYFMQWYTAVRGYPLDIGGRPLHSWPSFIPLTFELAVLGATLAMLVGMFVRNGFPQPYHPVFDAPGFRRASTDRFFLCVECADSRFDEQAVERLLDECGACWTVRVPLRTGDRESTYEPVLVKV
jgi:hypothetical protein